VTYGNSGDLLLLSYCLFVSQSDQAIKPIQALEKLALPSIFYMSFILDDVKLAELPNNSFE